MQATIEKNKVESDQQFAERRRPPMEQVVTVQSVQKVAKTSTRSITKKAAAAALEAEAVAVKREAPAEGG
ncbi:hypothetical protein Tco_0256801 [Tanacetum coccineum]